jgi:V/A-type H+-transporting ATPase subunit C
MPPVAEQGVLDFCTYPQIGGDDWRYAFQTAQVRALEMQMLSRAALVDMANAESFAAAADLLGASEYALGQGGRSPAEMESVLHSRRAAVRGLFADLMIDEQIAELFRNRDDFANIRVAVRRTLAENPIGTDYSHQGNVEPGIFQEVFEQESYDLLPDYMAEAVEQAVLAYYQDKDIRRIDEAIDTCQAQYELQRAGELDSVFLLSLFRLRIDLTNIRTMLRLKFAESERRNVFLEGGFLEVERFRKGLDAGYDALGPLFFATPFHRAIETGVNYLVSEKSFLKMEQQCDEYLMGFLGTTIQITAGPQPVIAFLLMKENEIRTVRLILTAKKNRLDTKLILDRIS